MKKDIEFPKVEGVKMAITLHIDLDENEFWDVQVINRNPFAIENVMVTSRGFGEIELKEIKTSILRHFIEKIETQSIAKIEAIQPELFGINNEFWLSYYIGSQLYDKKFLFLPDSIIKENLIELTPFGLVGVLHE
jgi:hypothetical protein